MAFQRAIVSWLGRDSICLAGVGGAACVGFVGGAINSKRGPRLRTGMVAEDDAMLEHTTMLVVGPPSVPSMARRSMECIEGHDVGSTLDFSPPQAKPAAGPKLIKEAVLKLYNRGKLALGLAHGWVVKNIRYSECGMWMRSCKMALRSKPAMACLDTPDKGPVEGWKSDAKTKPNPYMEIRENLRRACVSDCSLLFAPVRSCSYTKSNPNQPSRQFIELAPPTGSQNGSRMGVWACPESPARPTSRTTTGGWLG